MAGHSKWSKIRHAKGAADAKKGKIFSKLAQQISIAVKDGGGDVDSNPTLRKLVEKAKSESMPANNIQRAINKGLGVGENGEKIEECFYEGIGPGGGSIVVDVATDNKNRVVSDLRKIFSDSGGTLSNSGSVSWNFEQKGRVEVQCGKMVANKQNSLEEVFVESDYDQVLNDLLEIPGCIDIAESEESSIEVFSEAQDIHKVKTGIQNLGYVISNYGLIRTPKIFKDLSDEDLEKLRILVESLEEYPDVQNVWTDVKL